MTVLVGGYTGAVKPWPSSPERDAVDIMAFSLARFPGSRNGGILAVPPRNVAGSNSPSVHNTGRAWDWMTGTGQPTVESKWLAEQFRLFSQELGIQGLIHNRKQWWSNRGAGWTTYLGSNPHLDHIHGETQAGLQTSTAEIRSVLIGPSIDGNRLWAGSSAKRGSTGNPTRYIQDRLNAHGWALSEDGVFGAKTEAAVRTFQTLCGVAVDGIAGPVTQGRLR